MINTTKLNSIISASGHTDVSCAKYLGISTQAFQNRKNNRTQFRVSEFKRLIELLDIRPEDNVVNWNQH